MKLQTGVPEKTIEAISITHPTYGELEKVSDFDKKIITVRLDNGDLELFQKEKLVIKQFKTFHSVN